MKLAKSLAALLVCGSFAFATCDVAEAAQSAESAISVETIADFDNNLGQTEELLFGRDRRHPYPPPPPPPPPPRRHPPGPPPPPHYSPGPPHHMPPPPPPGHRPPPPGW